MAFYRHGEAPRQTITWLHRELVVNTDPLDEDRLSRVDAALQESAVFAKSLPVSDPRGADIQTMVRYYQGLRDVQLDYYLGAPVELLSASIPWTNEGGTVTYNDESINLRVYCRGDGLKVRVPCRFPPPYVVSLEIETVDGSIDPYGVALSVGQVTGSAMGVPPGQSIRWVPSRGLASQQGLPLYTAGRNDQQERAISSPAGTVTLKIKVLPHRVDMFVDDQLIAKSDGEFGRSGILQVFRASSEEYPELKDSQAVAEYNLRNFRIRSLPEWLYRPQPCGSPSQCRDWTAPRPRSPRPRSPRPRSPRPRSLRPFTPNQLPHVTVRRQRSASIDIKRAQPVCSKSTLPRPSWSPARPGTSPGHLVKRLLQAGVVFHAAVRDPGNPEKLKYLDEIAADASGRIRYFKSDLLQEGSYEEAMEGCSLVFHTASPFTSAVEDPQRELVDPALLGTQNVLQEVNRHPDVRRVVLTSSVAAIFGDNVDVQRADGGVLTEIDWNTTSSVDHQPYYYSKTVAERQAWKIAESQSRWDLVVINPSLVIGPGINPHATSESFALIKPFGDGSMKWGAPKFGLGCVDVRDVAQAHLAAAYLPNAQGRHIVSGHNTDLYEMAQTLVAKYGRDYPIPRRVMSKWLVWLLAPMVNESLTRKIVARNVGVPWRADNRKSVRELGITYRPMEESMEDMFAQMIESGGFDKGTK